MSFTAFDFLTVDLSAVRISIVDQNDNEPEFPGDFNFEIAEDASIGAEVGTVTAIDADSSKSENECSINFQTRSLCQVM